MRVLAFLLIGLAFAFPVTVSQNEFAAEWLVNGDFENTTEPFPAGWTIESGAPGQQAGLNGSDTTLLLHKKSAGNRALNLILNSPVAAIMNLRVELSGGLQACNGSWWVALIDDAMRYLIRCELMLLMMA